MVKAREVNRDIRSIAAKVKTAVFSYDDIHNSGINNEYHYDYEKIIKEVAKINDWDDEKAKHELIKLGILSPLPNGEYKVEVGTTTKNGGGLNYHGTTFFTLSNDAYEVKYHELAHSLQLKYNLFDDEKIGKLYRTSAKGIDEGKADDLQVDKIEYKQYLKEMHSESFAYAAMMLRAENPLDFAKQVYKAYNDARLKNLSGFFSFGKTEYGGDNNNDKFYATFPVMKETIKAVFKIRKQGKVKDFFDKDGVLKDEKLAKLCEQAVIKSAYSPRTLNSFFKYRILDGHNDVEHGWRKDAIQSVATMLQTAVVSLVSEDNLIGQWKCQRRHKQLEKEEKKKINASISQPKIFKDDETQALYDYIQLISRCNQVASNFKGQFISADMLLSQSLAILRDEKKIVHEPNIRNQARLMNNNLSAKKQKELEDNMIALAHFARDRKDNPYFCHLVQKDIDISEVVRMYQEKLKNPEKKQIETPVPIKVFPKKENENSAVNTLNKTMHSVLDLVEKYNLPKSSEQALTNLALQDYTKIDDPQMRKALADGVHFKGDILGIKKRKFKKDLEKTLDSISVSMYNLRNNVSFDAYREHYREQKTSLDDIIDETNKYYEERMKNLVKPKEKASQQEVIQSADNKEQAANILHNNLEAINYLADRYGISDNLRVQMQKMATLSEDKLASKQLRDSLCKAVHFGNDWFGREKRNFKRDFNRLMDSFIEDAKYQKDNPSYRSVCSEALEQLQENKDVSHSASQNVSSEKAEIKVSPKTQEVQEKPKTPKEKVAEKLKAWGIEEGTYIMLTPEDNAFRSYGNNESRSLKTCFEEGKNDLKETGSSVVYGTNNGLESAYFAEGVYVVACNDRLRDTLYRMGKNTGLGVVLSNGEHFMTADGKDDVALNNQWKLAKHKAEAANKQFEIELAERQSKAAEVNSKPSTQENTGAKSVYETLHKICELSDRLEPSGQLKEILSKAYIKNDSKVLSLEFWGNCAKKFADHCPEGKDAFLREAGKLGLLVGADMKNNKDNSQYNAVKERCSKCDKAQDMLKTADVCAKKSANIGVNMDTTLVR